MEKTKYCILGRSLGKAANVFAYEEIPNSDAVHIYKLSKILFLQTGEFFMSCKKDNIVVLEDIKDMLYESCGFVCLKEEYLKEVFEEFETK